jgi:hypothetical protein
VAKGQRFSALAKRTITILMAGFSLIPVGISKIPNFHVEGGKMSFHEKPA